MPYLSRRLLSDNNPRMRAALRHLLYGEGKRIDLARLSKMMSAFSNFSTDGELLLGLAGWVGGCVGGRAHRSALWSNTAHILHACPAAKHGHHGRATCFVSACCIVASPSGPVATCDVSSVGP
jgi:hypothetical protein